MEKICEICGGYFETTKPNKKYCDDCATQAWARNRERAREARKSKCEVYEPKLYEATCDCCGKEFALPSDVMSKMSYVDHKTGRRYRFCSGACMNAWTRKKLYCRNCGGSLEESPDFIPAKPSTHFCSDECKKEYARKQAIENGTLHVCPVCGKEFIRSGGIFCSKDCYNKAVKEGWRSKK